MRFGSQFLCGALFFGLLACAGAGDNEALAEGPTPKHTPEPSKQAAVKAETTLGVSDKGIWSDLDAKVSLPAPALEGNGTLLIDREHKLIVLYDGDHPIKAYPLSDSKGRSIKLAGETVSVRTGDAAELTKLGKTKTISSRVLAPGKAPPGGDADGDGIPNALDLLIGARKTVLNAATYGAGYIKLEYPNGDVPRDVGVCSDVVIRAVRNAGVDLQSKLQNDIKKAKKSYPMVKKRNSHIDHRRVKTLLPYFRRHWDERAKAIDDESDPLRPGDVVFMDTFPNRRGPDHIGIVSPARADSGNLLIINNWTDGSVTAEMDLLDFVPITHRFRMK